MQTSWYAHTQRGGGADGAESDPMHDHATPSSTPSSTPHTSTSSEPPSFRRRFCGKRSSVFADPASSQFAASCVPSDDDTTAVRGVGRVPNNSLRLDEMQLLSVPMFQEEVVLGRALHGVAPMAQALVHTIQWTDPFKSIVCVAVVAALTYHDAFDAWALWALVLQHGVCRPASPDLSDGDARLIFRKFLRDASSLAQSLSTRVALALVCRVALVLVAVVSAVRWFVLTDEAISDSTGQRSLSNSALGVATLVVLLGGRFVRLPYHPIDAPAVRGGAMPPEEAPSSDTTPTATTPSSPVSAATVPAMPSGPLDAQTIIQLCLAMQACPAWVPQPRRRDGITHDTMAIPWCPTKAVRIGVRIEAPMDFVTRFLLDDDFVKPIEELNIFKYDNMLQRYVRVKHGVNDGTNLTVVHTQYARPMRGIAPRDAVSLSTLHTLSEEEIARCKFNAVGADASAIGRVLCVGSSDGSTLAPPSEGYVRTKLHLHAMFFLELPGEESVRMVTVMAVDPSGHIPSMVVDRAQGDFINKAKSIRDVVEKYYQRQEGAGKP